MIAINERLSCALIDISLFSRVGLFVARSFTGHAIMWGARNGVLFKKQVLCVSMKAIHPLDKNKPIFERKKC